MFALACAFAYFQSKQRGGWSVCNYVNVLLNPPDGGGSGVQATEQTAFGCFVRWPAGQGLPVVDL